MNLTIFEEFKQITGYDIEIFYEDYRSFVVDFYPNILNYYNGGDIDQDSFNFLDYVKSESDRIEGLIDQYYNSFNITEYWDMIELFSDIQNSIYKVEVLYKWLRSSRTDRYSQNLKIDYIQKQNQSIEDLSTFMGYNNQNDWVGLAVQNQINEEDYTNAGGKFFKAILPNDNSFDLDNIVDSLQGDNIYGKDIYKVFVFENNDMKILQGKDSLNQTFATIMSTIAGSIPEFPVYGVPDYVYGTNQNIIQYPIIFRSLLNMFQRDKRFISFEILNINKDNDSVFIDTQTKAITSDIFTKNIKI